MYRDDINTSKLEVRQTKNLHRVCKVDQFVSKDFNNNVFGWTTNSISAMARAATYQEFLMLAQSISQSPAKYNLPDNCSFKDAISLCRPRFAQNPCELDIFAQQLADMDGRKLDEAYLKALKDVHPDNENTSSNETVVENEK